MHCLMGSMLLGVIVLLGSVNGLIEEVGFLIGLMTYQVTGFWSFSSVRYACHLMKWVLNKTKMWLLLL